MKEVTIYKKLELLVEEFCSNPSLGGGSLSVVKNQQFYVENNTDFSQGFNSMEELVDSLYNKYIDTKD